MAKQLAGLGDARVFLAVPAVRGVKEGLEGLLINSQQVGAFTIKPLGTSILPYTFNCLWATALNGREEHGWTHFAMHHDDVNVSTINWLDILVEEQQRTGADLLSVVVPIKDRRGLTSTGYLKPDGLIRRLTLREVYKLPETFGIEDITDQPGHQLVVNTGLWVCDFTKPWVEEVWFNNLDSIKKHDDGKFYAHTLSEDWDFSMKTFKNHNLKIMATRKIALKHHGEMTFSNQSPWGIWDADIGDEDKSEEDIHHVV